MTDRGPPRWRKTRPEREDVYTRVTNRIIADLEQGVRPWQKPWNAEHAAGHITRPLRHNGVPYQGINVLALWMESMDKGYAAPIWMTFNQAHDLGANVRKGEHGSTVIKASTTIKKEQGDDGEEHDVALRWAKAYTVFNVEQIEGLPVRYYAKAEPKLTPVERIEHAEEFFKNTGAEVRIGGTQALYAAQPDHIRIPPIEAFKDPESFYATLGHETAHWTKHPTRLNRDFGRKRFGDEGYAMEELVAELSAAMACADLEITPVIRDDHAQYVGNWLKVLKNDKHAVFSAAGHAQKAVEFMHALQPGYEAPTQEQPETQVERLEQRQAGGRSR